MRQAKIPKRLAALFVALMLIVGMVPMTVFAQSSITYLDENGESQTLSDTYTSVTASDTTWSEGWYVADGEVTIDSHVTVTGDAKLILKDGAALTVNGGINVPTGSTFTVYGQQNGTGNLTSIGTNGYAGIGGTGSDVNFGTIILAAKGRIVATGDTRAAGIGGGGLVHNGESVNGSIHIYQGTIEATGGSWAAGIGGGADSSTDCTITIDGGTIIAQGGQDNAGIGGTNGSKQITINGGTVTAHGGNTGAGIGGCYDASGGSITITGGVIDADSIGGGSAGSGGSGGTIVISGGVVTADRIGAGATNQEGSFSTTGSGNAVIFAGSITDQSGKSGWSGIIFENGIGSVYGSSVTVTDDFEIPQDYQLTVGSGQTLVIGKGVQLTNKGTIANEGSIQNDGVIYNDGGTITGTQPVTVIHYLDEMGNDQVLNETYTLINTANTPTSWRNGWYVVDGSVTIGSRVTVTGDVKLILKNGASLTVNGGINVSQGNALTIYAQSTDESTMGILTATAANKTNNAGIGGNSQQTSGSITINGGKIVAMGDSSGAGIGGGYWGAGGTTAIHGGVVSAVGGSINNTNDYGNGAGIGGGYCGNGGEITITGGVVSATGGGNDYKASAGIGGGGGTPEEPGFVQFFPSGDGGVVSITGGIVTVIGHNVGIGGGGINDVPGTFTACGDAVIFASSISDQSGKEGWRGLIFQGSEGKVYGTSYTVDEALTIPADKTLTIEHGDTLTVTSGVTLTNNGAIHVNHGGTYSGAHPSGNAVMYQIDWDTNGDGTVDDTTYVAYGETPSHADGRKTGDAQYNYQFTGWSPTLAAVTGTATYTAQFTQSVNSYEVTVPTDPGYTVTYTVDTELEYNSTFTFTVDINQGYYKTPAFAVKANGTPLAADTDGNYTVQVLGNTQITVEGVAKEAALAVPTVNTHGYDSEWTANDVTLTPSATADSGIAYYEYSKNGGESWTKLTGESLTISESYFATDYIFRAVSNAGNLSEASSPVTVKIDKNAPGVNLTGNTGDYLLEDSIRISLIVGLSGISKVEVQKKDGSWETLSPSEDSQFVYLYTATENGTYTFRATSGTGVISEETSITYDKIDSVKPVVSIDSGDYTADTWTNQNVSLSVSNTAANLGTTTFQYKVDNGEWQDYTGSITISEETAGTTYTFKAVSASGVASDEASITVKLDKTAPDGDIKIQENSVKKLLNQITFGLFFNKNVDVDITGTDALSGVASIQFYRSDEILTQEEVAAITDWSDYSSITETAVDAEKFLYYAKITDHAGNFTVIGSNGVTFDLTAPTITGVTNGSTYYTTQTVTVADANLASVTLNGVADDETLTLAGNVEQTYTIVATDQAGNKTEYTVTMKPIESLGDSIQGITTDNVTSANQADIQSVQQAVAGVDTEDATQAEQDALKAMTDHCAALLTQVTEVADEMAALTQAVNALPNADTITSAHKDTVNDLMTRLDALLNSTNLTQAEREAMTELNAICENLLTLIQQSAQAGTTENIDKVEDITSDNVSLEDQDDLTAAKEDLENALDNFGENYTEEEKAALEDKLEQINQALESIEQVATAQDAIEALPDSVEPDDTDAAALIKAAKVQYDALTEHEKTLVGEALKNKLDILLAALVDYRMTQGTDAQWTQGTQTGLVFTVNGALTKFTGIEVDGKAVEQTHYTAISGSTIITLKPEYLATLSMGKHTLTVRFTDGQVNGQFEVLAKPESGTPDTGDNNQVTLWIALMVVAVFALAGTIVYTRMKKHRK